MGSERFGRLWKTIRAEWPAAAPMHLVHVRIAAPFGLGLVLVDGHPFEFICRERESSWECEHTSDSPTAVVYVGRHRFATLWPLQPVGEDVFAALIAVDDDEEIAVVSDGFFFSFSMKDDEADVRPVDPPQPRLLALLPQM